MNLFLPEKTEQRIANITFGLIPFFNEDTQSIAIKTLIIHKKKRV